MPPRWSACSENPYFISKHAAQRGSGLKRVSIPCVSNEVNHDSDFRKQAITYTSVNKLDLFSFYSLIIIQIDC